LISVGGDYIPEGFIELFSNILEDNDASHNNMNSFNVYENCDLSNYNSLIEYNLFFGETLKINLDGIALGLL
jgi:hypothetical protein